MYELNCQVFRQMLEDASEDTAENAFQEIDPYLLETVCFPILHRQPLIPNQIDYTRFTIEELYDLLDAAQLHFRRCSCLLDLNRHLCSRTVPQNLRRAFC